MEPESPPAVARGRRSRLCVARCVSWLAVLSLAAACSSPAPEPEPEEQVPPGVIWSGDFDTGDLGDWAPLESAEGRVELVDEPVRAGSHAVRLTADQADRPGQDVRTQLNGPMLFDEGDEAYVAWSSYLPSDIPDIPPGGWFVFFEFHGSPFDGSPLPGAFGLTNDDGEQRIKLARSQKYDYDTPWSMPIVHDRWIDFVAHVKFSKDENVGFVELWVDGEQQRFNDGATRLQQSTIMESQDEGLSPIATNYYKSDTLEGPVTLYHDEIVVAENLGAAVPPRD